MNEKMATFLLDRIFIKQEKNSMEDFFYNFKVKLCKAFFDKLM